VVGSVRYYLPPWISVRDSWSQNVEVLKPPYGTRPIIAEVYDNEPVSLTLEATGIAESTGKARQVLDWMAELRSQLRGRTFSLYLFNDRGYETCALTGNEQNIPLGRLTFLDTTIGIISETSSEAALPTLDFPSGYDNEYPYAHLVGRPDGEASTGGGISVIQAPRQTPGGHFPGPLYAVTAAGDEQRFTVGGGEGSQWTLDQLQITSAGIGDASGPTTIVLSTTPIGVSGTSTQATVSSAQKFSTVAISGITVTAGTTLYAYATAAGGHTDVQFAFQLKG
jgi:hypothetical protein